MASMSSSRTYRTTTGAHSFDFQLDGDTLRVDGEPVAYTLEPVSDNHYLLVLDGRSFSVVVEPEPDGRMRVTLGGRQIVVGVQDEKDLLLERFGLADERAGGIREVRAPMPGLVLSVAVEPGAAVEAGDRLLVLEAMKMENELRAEAAGTVQAVHVAPGDAVTKNALLIEFDR